MKLQIIETIESDGRWLKVKQNGMIKACFKFGKDARPREEAMQMAEEVFQFIHENGDQEKVVKEYDSMEV